MTATIRYDHFYTLNHVFLNLRAACAAQRISHSNSLNRIQFSAFRKNSNSGARMVNSPVASSPPLAGAPESAAAAVAAVAASEDYSDFLMSLVRVPPPPGFVHVGARVEHLIADREATVAELVCEALTVPEAYTLGLLRLGAIYFCPVPPLMSQDIKSRMPEERRAAAERLRAEALEVAGKRDVSPACKAVPAFFPSSCIYSISPYCDLHK
jgi:hypothetical protein